MNDKLLHFAEERTEILKTLGKNVEKKIKKTFSPEEERIIAGFEEISDFIDQHNRLPTLAADKDIFERIYATRLQQIKKLPNCKQLLTPFDKHNILNNSPSATADTLSRREILKTLGTTANENDITNLKHVKTRAEIQAAEEIANRIPCRDFATFKPLFEQVQLELENGTRTTKKFDGYTSPINKGDFFILSGQKTYIAEKGEVETNKAGYKDAKLRVIYDNGTESPLLMRSLARALNKDDTGRSISEPTAGPLFSDKVSNDDFGTGTIYICRSESPMPEISENKKLIHKIGVTSGNVKTRIVNAENDPTFLMAKVQVVGEYQLYNINRKKLEEMLHKFFAEVRVQPKIKDRFGKTITPREWFFVPLNIIEEVVERIKDESITDYKYNAETVRLEQAKPD